MRRKKQHRKEPLLRHIGDALRSRRIDLLISQDELARLSDLHRTYITDVESGYRNISLLTYEKLTSALKCALSLPMIQAEGNILSENRLTMIDGLRQSISSKVLQPRDSKSFAPHLKDLAIEAAVTANMTKLQVSIERYATITGGIYPRNSEELRYAIGEDLPINPITNAQQLPSMGTVENELLALKASPDFLHPGSMEYSSIKDGMNYIIRGGAANGKSLPGRIARTSYILSGNLQNDNQP